MTTNVFRLYRSGADYAPTGVAAAPTGDTYVVVGDPDALGDGVTLLRTTSTGTISWSKQFVPDDDSFAGGNAFVASNSSDVAVSYTYDNGAGQTTIVSKYDSSGTLAWRQGLDLYSVNDYGLAVSADGSVYITARGVADNDTYLVKLNTSTGAISWSVILRQSGQTTASLWNGPIATLAGNDVVAVVFGAVLADGFSKARIQRLAASDGAIAWTQTVQWPDQSSHFSSTALAVDGSDNIYAYGPKLDATSPPENAAYTSFPVVKLDSAGATLWKRIVKPSGTPSNSYDIFLGATRRGTAGSTGLYFPLTFNTVTTYYGGTAFVPAAGTVGANAQLIQYARVDSGGVVSTTAYGSATLNSDTHLGLISDSNGTYKDAFITSSGNASADDSSWGAHVRTTLSWSLVDASSNITLTSETFTRAATSSFAATTPSTVTTGTSNVVSQSWASVTSANATGIDNSNNLFGTPTGQYPPGTATGILNVSVISVPRGVRVEYATGIAGAETFGVPGYRFLAYPAGIAATSAVGSSAVNLNLSYGATALAVATAFGQPWAEKGMPAGANVADGIVNVSALGEPSALATISAAAEGFSTTALGTPTAVYVQAATGFSTTAFGTPALRTPCNATGISTTAFGTVTVQMFGLATGLSDPTVFGTPSWTRLSSLSSTGLASTAGFGTPDCIENLQHARSHLSRTRFGAPTITRTAP